MLAPPIGFLLGCQPGNQQGASRVESEVGGTIARASASGEGSAPWSGWVNQRVVVKFSLPLRCAMGRAGLLLFCLFGALTTSELAKCLGGMLAADMCRDHWVSHCARSASSCDTCCGTTLAPSPARGMRVCVCVCAERLRGAGARTPGRSGSSRGRRRGDLGDVPRGPRQAPHGRRCAGGHVCDDRRCAPEAGPPCVGSSAAASAPTEICRECGCPPRGGCGAPDEWREHGGACSRDRASCCDWTGECSRSKRSPRWRRCACPPACPTAVQHACGQSGSYSAPTRDPHRPAG